MPTFASSDSQSIPTTGLATMFGVIGLANPRVIPGTKTIVFDAQIYLGPGEDGPRFLLGALRYYNGDNLTFSETAQLYAVYSTFACKSPSAELNPSSELSADDYCFVGDIQMIIPLGPPGPRFVAQDVDELKQRLNQNDEDGMYVPDDIPTFEINACKPPLIQVTGVASNCQKESSTFSMGVEQYVSCLKSSSASSSTTGTSSTTKSQAVTSFSCYIPDSPRYKNGKPMPFNKRYVSVCGPLTDVVASNQKRKQGLIDSFELDVMNITFCGHYLPPASQTASGNTPLKSSNGSTKSLFSYGIPKTPRTPQTPTPSQSTRPLKRARTDSSSDDSGDAEGSKENVFS